MQAGVRIGIVLLLGWVLGTGWAHAQTGPVLNAALLPNMRTVPVDATATFFMTVLNSGDADASNCQVVRTSLVGGYDAAPFDMEWALTDAGGGLVGNQNDPFSVVAGGSAKLVIGIKRGAAAGQYDNNYAPNFHVECDGNASSLAWPAVNGVTVNFSDTQTDIIPVLVTGSGDGIAKIDGFSRLGVVSVAAINNTALAAVASTSAKPLAGEVTVGVGAYNAGYSDMKQMQYFACETDNTGACVSGLHLCTVDQYSACFQSDIGDTPKTFSFFPYLEEGRGEPFQPNLNRFAVGFFNEYNTVIAASSAALDSDPTMHIGGAPAGQYELNLRNTDDPGARTLRSGRLNIGDTGGFGEFYRNVDLGAYILIVPQYFSYAGDWSEAGGGNTCSENDRCEEAMWSGISMTYYWDYGGATPNGAQTTGDATVQPEAGGTITLPDAPGEQIAGEPDLFDALQAGLLHARSDLNSTLREEAFNDLVWENASTDGYNFDTPPDDVPGYPGFFSYSIAGCTVSPSAKITSGREKVVTGSVLRITECAADSPLLGYPEYSEASMFVQKRPDGSYILKFVLLKTPEDPESEQYVLYVKARPATQPANSQTIAGKSRAGGWVQQSAQELANRTGKPVHIFVNGRSVPLATPRREAYTNPE